MLHPRRDSEGGRFIPAISYSENDVILRLKERDARAMTDLYDQFARLVYGIIYNAVRESAVSEDLSQETFWRIWNRIQTFDSKKGKLEPWIATIARNSAIDYLRSARSRQSCVLITSETLFLSTPSPVTRLEREEFIVMTLRSLNPGQRQIIDLVYFEGFTLLESAEILQRPLPSVKSTVRTALKVLRGAADGLAANPAWF